MAAQRFGLLDGGRDDGAAVDKRRRARLVALCSRAVASVKARGDGGPVVSLVLIADGSNAPASVVPVHAATDAAALGEELDETIADDAALSKATAYRVLVQEGDETTHTLSVRVRAESRHTLDAHLRGQGESTEAAVVRQLMRHNEEQARLFLGMFERIAAVDEKRQARVLERLERLEVERESVENKSVERLKLELELHQAARRAEMQDDALRQVMPLLMPAAARLAGHAARALAGDNAPAAQTAPAQKEQPRKADLALTNKGGSANELDGRTPPIGSSPDDGGRLLGIVKGLDPDAVEALAGWLTATGREDDARDLRRIAAERKDGTT